MWKCKKCGEKIQGYYTGLVDIDKKGCAIDGTQEDEELVEYLHDCFPMPIKYCRIEELKKFATWEEENERD